MIVERVNINGLEFNRTDSELSWRLVYNNDKVIDLFQSDGFTETIHNIFLAKSKEACLAEIYKLNLEYNLSENNYNP